MKIGIYAPGFDSERLTGPWLALLRLCRALLNMEHGHEICFLHYRPGNLDIYQQAPDIIVPKIPFLAERKLKSMGIELVCLNGIPSSLKSFLFHTYPSLNTMAIVHGTLPWVADYAYGDALRPKGVRKKLNSNWTKQLMRKAASRFAPLVANSYFTREVLVNEMGVENDRCKVVHCGLDHEIFQIYDRGIVDEVKDENSVHDDYIISVGHYGIRKNSEGILRAYAILRDRGHKYKLLIVGGGWSPRAISSCINYDTLGNDIILTGYLGEHKVAKLYSGALLLVFPTLHETFGMPLVEAMACGCPVVSSNCTAVPEVAGDAALLADDPTDPYELADLMEKIMADSELRQEMVERGLDRARQFTWTKAAREYIEVFDRIEGGS